MAEPIFNPGYWKTRLFEAIDREQIHQAVMKCSPAQWQVLNEHYRKKLASFLSVKTSIIDVGCGWGRLLSLVPDWWRGAYLGVDLCPDFIDIAIRTHPGHNFLVHDLRLGPPPDPHNRVYDYAVGIGFKGMILGNARDDWPKIEEVVNGLSHRQCYMEMD